MIIKLNDSNEVYKFWERANPMGITVLTDTFDLPTGIYKMSAKNSFTRNNGCYDWQILTITKL